MITTVAQLLQELLAKEAARLKEENIVHAPTIGAMYEGLTREMLERTLPASTDLRIVNGFVEDHEGKLGPQLDAMLVTGEGRQIPHTDSFVWPILKVLAVIEVKKNLFGADLDDAFDKMRAVSHMHGRAMEALSKAKKFDLQPTFHSFAMLTGQLPRDRKEVDALPEELAFLFHALVVEQFAPIRIIIGYEGYADEYSLRQGLLKFIESKLASPQGYGISSFPNLIICRENSLLKTNGFPYATPLLDGWWPAIVSTNQNPLRLLIELVWTRLSHQFGIDFPMDDSLEQERLSGLLSARFQRQGDKIGWSFRATEFKRAELNRLEPENWEPEAANPTEMVVLVEAANKGELNIRDEGLRSYILGAGFDPDYLIDRLVSRRLLAYVDKDTVRLIRSAPLITSFLPDGRAVAGHAGELLDLWIGKQLQKDDKKTDN